MECGLPKPVSHVVKTNPQNCHDGDLETALKRRLGDVAAIGELMPLVVAVTLAQCEHWTGSDQ
jgi:hypothetical protein